MKFETDQLERASPIVPMFLTCLCLVYLVNAVLKRTTTDLMIPVSAIIAALIGPVFLSGAIWKEYWGRPRLFYSLDFSGDWSFVQLGMMPYFCQTNFPFVPGEATADFTIPIRPLFAGKAMKKLD